MTQTKTTSTLTTFPQSSPAFTTSPEEARWSVGTPGAVLTAKFL